jgi:hypothetical protein
MNADDFVIELKIRGIYFDRPMLECTLWGENCGGSIAARSNFMILRDMTKSKRWPLIERYERFKGRRAWLAIDFDNLIEAPEEYSNLGELLEILDGLTDYPVLNDAHYSELEHDLAWQSWKNFYWPDIVRDVERATDLDLVDHERANYTRETRQDTLCDLGYTWVMQNYGECDRPWYEEQSDICFNHEAVDGLLTTLVDYITECTENEIDIDVKEFLKTEVEGKN